jgi:hypothetical protein
MHSFLIMLVQICISLYEIYAKISTWMTCHSDEVSDELSRDHFTSVQSIWLSNMIHDLWSYKYNALIGTYNTCFEYLPLFHIANSWLQFIPSDEDDHATVAKLTQKMCSRIMMLNHTMKLPFSSSWLKLYSQTMNSLFFTMIMNSHCYFDLCQFLVGMNSYPCNEFRPKSMISHDEFIYWNAIFPFLVGANSCFLVWIHSIFHEVCMWNSGLIS